MFLQIPEIQLTIFIGSLIVLFFAVIIIITITQYKQRVYKHELEVENMEAQFAKTLLQSQLEIKDQTLKHVAFELHDNIGQIASLIKIHLHTLKLDDPEGSVKKVEEAKDLLRQLIGDVKAISLNLNSDRVGQMGIKRAVNLEIEKLKKIGRFQVEFYEEGTTPALDASTSTILYRIIQEIIHNSVKHSQATQIHILMRTTENLFTLVFTDNGIGFIPEEKMSGSGSGLFILQQRANMINACLTINSKPQSGTRIVIERPVTHVSKSAH